MRVKATKQKKSIPIIVIGASAGGLAALINLVPHLPDKAAVFAVLHLSHSSIGDFVVTKLQEYTSYNCKLAEDGEVIKLGNIYIAPPNRHLLMDEGKVVLGQGPAENRWRPSIDVLFRSAAVNHNSNVVGIILTGLLNDGVAGMGAIKKCGGLCIVQDPAEAEYADMPKSVLTEMAVHHTLRIADMGGVLHKWMLTAKNKKVTVPENLKAEATIAENTAIGIDKVSRIGKQSLFTCPDCGGSLWEMKDKTTHRYRCFTGHSYTQNDLIIKQNEREEGTLWVALRLMEERRNLLLKMQVDYKAKGYKQTGEDYGEKAAQLATHIARLREILFAIQDDSIETEKKLE